MESLGNRDKASRLSESRHVYTARPSVLVGKLGTYLSKVHGQVLREESEEE